jgi:hypothetical protein
MGSWDGIVEAADRVPPGAWMIAAIVAVAATWRTAGRRMRRAGERTGDPTLVAQSSRAKDTALTVAAMVPAVLFWAVVLAGSFRGLVAFGRNTLRWEDGWEYLVPGSLDGVSVTFALLAFRAVRKQKTPDRCYRVVWAAAIAAATVNFNYEYAASGHNLVAGAYLALLSLFGMFMFHEFLHQFEEGTGNIKRGKPAFGLRWFTWPTNTLCAAVAWQNHPPVRGTAPTVRNAVANLERVRELKRAAKEAATREHHTHALAHAKRRAELAAARHHSTPSGAAGEIATASANGHRATSNAHAERGTSASPAAGPADALAALPSGQTPPATVKVPGTAWRLQRWIDTWVAMCSERELVLGPITDDQHARATYGASARHLDNIRKAAVSGAIRQRALDLDVALPPSTWTTRPGGG